MNNLEMVIEEAAKRGAIYAINKLKNGEKIRHYFSNAFEKTEELLYLHDKLPEENEMRQRIDQALQVIENDDYYGVIPSIYFDKMTLAELSDIYDCKYQNISKNRNRMIKILACELFPEEVLKDIMEK